MRNWEDRPGLIGRTSREQAGRLVRHGGGDQCTRADLLDVLAGAACRPALVTLGQAGASRVRPDGDVAVAARRASADGSEIENRTSSWAPNGIHSTGGAPLFCSAPDGPPVHREDLLPQRRSGRSHPRARGPSARRAAQWLGPATAPFVLYPAAG